MLVCELLNFGLEWLTLLAPATAVAMSTAFAIVAPVEAVAAETAAFERSNGS